MKQMLQAAAIGLLVTCASCKKEQHPPAQAQLIIKFRFDSTQVRLNNIGLPCGIPAGNAAQHPVFSTMSAHYVELAPTAFTPLGQGKILYRATETAAGGTNAIDFEKATLTGN